MPVVGHALAGLALATCAVGAERSIHPTLFGRGALTLVVLAYLPDVVAQAGIAAGFRLTPTISHSVLFASAVAALLAPFVARALDAPIPHGFALGLLSLLLHDIMDIAQSPGRMPLWPLPMGVDIGTWFPDTLAGEMLVCLPFIVAALVWRRWRGWPFPTQVDWMSLTAVAIIVCVAASVSELREQRERALNRARTLAESGQYAAALEACDTADRWPSPAAPGRVDYVRAMSWWALGRADRAESLYLRSYEADPNHIWTAGDLAALYASSDVPTAERRRKAESWLRVLQNRFAGNPALPRLVARVQRRLETPR